MGVSRATTMRNGVSVALVAALLGAGAVALVRAHPFTDDDLGGIRLLGSHHPVAPHSDGHTPPGWSQGDKAGWQGKAVPPGWLHPDEHGDQTGGPHGGRVGWNGRDVPPGWAHADKHGWEDHGRSQGSERPDEPGPPDKPGRPDKPDRDEKHDH